MKRELALQLLRETIPGLGDEGDFAQLFRELQFLAEYKYNKYEMYHPGRLFLESLALWLQQFQENERKAALDFLRRQLIFVSRQEFQQLAGLLYHDVIKRSQMDVAADMTGYPRYKVRAIHASKEFSEVEKASLYVGMSDGARIDHIRRLNLTISNEQVLPYYDASQTKVSHMNKELCRRLSDPEAGFHCLFLIDDFCGSGRTLLREVVTAEVGDDISVSVPDSLRSKLNFDSATKELELQYEGEIPLTTLKELEAISPAGRYIQAVKKLVRKSCVRDTKLKGALTKIATGPIKDVLHKNALIIFCPLIATQHAINRLESLVPRLPSKFSNLRILPGAIIDHSVEITSNATPIGGLCEKYYSEEFADEHTGCVKFGFDGCGLPLVLHHNTPNNSIYLLWTRKKEAFSPLFVRYERHGREKE